MMQPQLEVGGSLSQILFYVLFLLPSVKTYVQCLGNIIGVESVMKCVHEKNE